ncbi:MAG: hypothetical protein ACK56I_32855, partial [bacterium]
HRRGSCGRRGSGEGAVAHKKPAVRLVDGDAQGLIEVGRIAVERGQPGAVGVHPHYPVIARGGTAGANIEVSGGLIHGHVAENHPITAERRIVRGDDRGAPSAVEVEAHHAQVRGHRVEVVPDIQKAAHRVDGEAQRVRHQIIGAHRAGGNGHFTRAVIV